MYAEKGHTAYGPLYDAFAISHCHLDNDQDESQFEIVAPSIASRVKEC